MKKRTAKIQRARRLTEEEAWFNQGNRQYEAGDFEGAIASYNQAIKIKPNYY